MSHHNPVFDRPTHATYAFGGLIGERIAANERNWLMVAPLANPAMLTMFCDRDRRLDPWGHPADDGQPASERLLVWSGEFAGKYLISAVQGFRLTKNQRLLAMLREFVGELVRHQAPDGYLGPFEHAQRMTGRTPRGHALWDFWGQYHCMLGLYYWFKETGDTTALSACTRAADLFCRSFLDVEGKTWQFARGDESIIAKRMRLLPGGIVAGHSHPNEARWGLEGETLVFFAQDGRASTRFTWASLEHGRRLLRGTFAFDPRITHVLSEVEPDVTRKVWRFARADGEVVGEPIRLLGDGRLGGYNHPNEARWGLDGEVLIFFAHDGVPTTRFDSVAVEHGVTVYRGAFLPNPSIGHVLTEIYHPEPAKNHACAHIFALLHQETGDPRYRQLLREIEHAWETSGGNYVSGFQNKEPFFQSSLPRWESLHSVQAVVELYLMTADEGQRERYRRAAQQIWSSILASDRHNTGGFSSLEFATGNPYDPRPIETCGTVAWMALTLDVLRMSGESRGADELEISTWNAVLGAQSPAGRWWTYNTPMGGVPTAGMGAMDLPPPLGGRPPFELGERRPARYDLHFQDTITRGTSHLSCCAANGPRGLGILSEWAVMIGNDAAITLNYYGPSAFTVRAPSGRDVSLVQETDYPISGRILLSIVPAAEEQFRLQLRIPGWSRTTVVRLNGEKLSDVAPGTYFPIDRLWRMGDTLELILDMGPYFLDGDAPPPHTDPMGGSTVGMVSVFHGPLLLAFDARLNSHDPLRLPPLLQSKPPSLLTWPPNAPRPLLLQQFQTARGPMTLCDFASAGFEFRPPPQGRPNPFTGWRFSRGDGSVIAEHIHLERDGHITGYTHPNEARWGFEGDVLVFFAQDGRPSTRFTWVSLDEERHTLRGVFEFDRRIVHVLSEDDTMDWTRLWQFGRAGDSIPIAERLLLRADGTIGGHHHPNEARWGIEGGTLVFYAQDGRPSTRFNWLSRENGQRVLRGVFRFDPSITHVLQELDLSVNGKVWEFNRIEFNDEDEKPISAGVQLLPGGFISGHSHPNEARWGFEGDDLVFFAAHGPVSTRFTSLRMQHGRAEWRGRFEFDPRLRHVLRERDLEVTNKLWRFVRKWPANSPGAIDLRLLSNNFIDGGNHPNESRWGFEAGTLVFRAANGITSTRYETIRVGTVPDAFDFRGVTDNERRMIREGVFQLAPGITHELRESNIDLGWTGGSAYASWLPVSEGSLGFQIARTRFAPQVLGNRILVVTNDGRVFAREVNGNTTGASSMLAGPRVAANPWDKWVVATTSRILVIVNDGAVFAHDIVTDTIGVPVHLPGPPVARNDADKWVVTIGSRILVIVNDGRVFAHDITHHSVGVALQLTGPPVAANPWDKWVLTMGNRILVIVNNGSVFAHDVVGNTIGAPVRLNGPPVAANPWDKWVLTMGNRILVIVNDGKVFAHDISNNTVGMPFQLS